MIIKEKFNSDFINDCVADMQAIGYEYSGTDSRGRLLFDSEDGNSNQAFSDWNEVNKYLEDGSFPYEFESCVKEDVEDDIVDIKLEDIDYVMYNDLSEYYVEIVTDNTFGEYEVMYDDVRATVKFDLSSDNTAHYVFYINNEGPYEYNSSERVCMAIKEYLESITYSNLDECDNTNEDILNEFSSNFEGTEFDEVEFYSDTLRNVSSSTIANTIETGCDLHNLDINIYDIEIDTMGTMIISYEVKEEDYNPDVIEAMIIDILEGMEDRIRA